DEDQPWPAEPHRDDPPEGAMYGYRGIVGVALSDADADDGAPRVWPSSHRGPLADHHRVALAAGDALVMHPDLAHSAALNRGPGIRYAVYFRLVAGSSTR